MHKIGKITDALASFLWLFRISNICSFPVYKFLIIIVLSISFSDSVFYVKYDENIYPFWKLTWFRWIFSFFPSRLLCFPITADTWCLFHSAHHILPGLYHFLFYCTFEIVKFQGRFINHSYAKMLGTRCWARWKLLN